MSTEVRPSNLVVRLRAVDEELCYVAPYSVHSICEEAADEIDRLRDNLMECEAALADARSMNYESELAKEVEANKQLRALLREWLAGCPCPPDWHWSFNLNIRTVNALSEAAPPDSAPGRTVL